MEFCKRRNTKVQQALVIFCVVTLAFYLLFTNEGFIEFWDALEYRMTEFQPYLSHNVNDVKLLLWTRKNEHSEVYLNMSSLVLNTKEFNM